MVTAQYLCREQPPVQGVLWPPGIALTPVEVELTQPEFVLQGTSFQCCIKKVNENVDEYIILLEILQYILIMKY